MTCSQCWAFLTALSNTTPDDFNSIPQVPMERTFTLNATGSWKQESNFGPYCTDIPFRSQVIGRSVLCTDALLKNKAKRWHKKSYHHLLLHILPLLRLFLFLFLLLLLFIIILLLRFLFPFLSSFLLVLPI